LAVTKPCHFLYINNFLSRNEVLPSLEPVLLPCTLDRNTI
jgi:hypothetical protein